MQSKACFAGEIVSRGVFVDGPHMNPGARAPILEPLCTLSGTTETTLCIAIFAWLFTSCGMTECKINYLCDFHVSHSQEVLLVLGGLQQLFNLLFAT